MSNQPLRETAEVIADICEFLQDLVEHDGLRARGFHRVNDNAAKHLEALRSMDATNVLALKLIVDSIDQLYEVGFQDGKKS